MDKKVKIAFGLVAALAVVAVLYYMGVDVSIRGFND